MKYIIIFTFLTLTTLFSNDEIVLIDNTQSTLSEVESLPDATLLDVPEDTDSRQQEIVYCQNNDDLDINSLPDATVVEVIEPDEEIAIETNSSIDLDSIPDATVIEENVEPTLPSKPIETKITLEKNTTKIDKVISIADQNSTKQTPEQPDQNISNIIIVKTLDNSSQSINDENQKEKIDFWRLLDQTLLNSTALILKKYDIAITKENMQIIKSQYYPNISLTYAGEYYHSYEKGDASISGSYYPSYSQFRDSAGLSLQYELYRFGATDLLMEISQKELDIIRSELALTEEEVSKKLLEYFRQALKSQELIKYKEKMRLIQDTILQKKRRLYEVGKMTKIVLAKDELSMANIEREILKHKLDFKNAVKRIQILSNIKLNPNDIEFVMIEPKHCETKSFEESMLAKNLQLKIEKQSQEIELLKKDDFPGFYLDSGYRFYGADENNFLQTVQNLERNSWNVGISVRWNLFDGHKTDAKITKSKLKLQKLIEQYKLAKLDFESREKKRELLKKTFDKILQAESKIIDQTFQQEEMYARLQSAGQIDTIQLDYIEINKLKNELSFKLSVIDKVYETVSSELII